MDSPLRLTTKKSLAKLCLEIVQITENSKYDQPIYDIFNMVNLYL